MSKKRLVRYKEGAEMYSMGMNKFQILAKDAGAILKIGRMVLVALLPSSSCKQMPFRWAAAVPDVDCNPPA